MALGARTFEKGVNINLSRMRESSGNQWFDVTINDAGKKNNLFDLDSLSLYTGKSLRDAITEAAKAYKFFHVPVEQRVVNAGFILKHSSVEQVERYLKEIEDAAEFVGDFYDTTVNADIPKDEKDDGKCVD